MRAVMRHKAVLALGRVLVATGMNACAGNPQTPPTAMPVHKYSPQEAVLVVKNELRRQIEIGPDCGGVKVNSSALDESTQQFLSQLATVRCTRERRVIRQKQTLVDEARWSATFAVDSLHWKVTASLDDVTSWFVYEASGAVDGPYNAPW